MMLELFIFLDFFGAWSDSGCNLKNETDSTIFCECDHLTPFGVLFVSHMSYIVIVTDHIIFTHMQFAGFMHSLNLVSNLSERMCSHQHQHQLLMV